MVSKNITEVNNMALIKNYIIELLVFLVIDMVWLTVIAKSLYSKYLGYLMAENVNFIAALI